ncbi:LysR family transcriptional regulator [Pelagibius sp. Alg239-R121]|uniref:helix-turn-helix domain-containing protein n=1 Tax=Pelagibius sp. Alg239-R121 TaxID=2993448 RepID=UPI002AC36347|nr:LysR family transcriptional regulator [Pelagibius sp. Alg239-R121]
MPLIRHSTVSKIQQCRNPVSPNLRHFSAVARHRNFRMAADELGVLPSALSHTLRNLEQRMGLRRCFRTHGW